MVVYGDLPAAPGRPAVRLNRIASIDGATRVAGVSGGLGGPADHALFAVLRSLAEGGPALNGQLERAGLLDELCLTLSPRLAGGDAKRILTGPSVPAAAGLWLRSACEQDEFLFLRYRPCRAESSC
jgi:5-amino-6-(5-phosphoribosylamino)uracil reductase